MFKNMPKKLRDSLTPEQHIQRNEAMHLLLLNIAFCHIKRETPREGVKFAKEALEYNKENPKAYFRLAIAQKNNGELEPAKESMLKAVALAPGDLTIRAEYKQLMDLMNVKHKEWYQKMNGFLHSDKMRVIDQRDEEEDLLKKKLLKKEFDWKDE